MRDISLWAPLGWLLLVGGVGLAAWGCFYDASIQPLHESDRILNIGLLATKMTILGAGGLAFCSGVLVLQVDGARRDLRDMAKQAETRHAASLRADT